MLVRGVLLAALMVHGSRAGASGDAVVVLHGAIETAAGEPLPGDIEVLLSALPNSADPTAPVTLRCPIDQGAWSCPGPSGSFDVRLEAAGYAPRYAWDVRLEPGASVDLGRTVLRRAASVVGRAVGGDASSPRGPCRATLREDGTRRGTPRPGPEDAHDTTSVPLSAHGRFHIVGVAPGEHLLAVECETASASREVRVRAARETRIDPPLRLEELSLDVVVTPRVGPDGQPWRLSVAALAPRFRRVADGAAASIDGHWAQRGLAAGTYRVDLESRDGTRWLQRFVELHAGSGPLPLRVAFVKVAGRVRLGSQPLRARLEFFNQDGGEPAMLASDGDGRFAGLLPMAPDVAETGWTVEAHVADPPIRRRLEGVRVLSVAGKAADPLDLALPAVAVRGTVVSEDGEPQVGAQVIFEDAAGARTVAATDDAGAFELAELPPGSYTAVAESVEGVSERATLEVAEGLESELPLVLERAERVAFHVVGSEGPVADAAIQAWFPPGTPRGFTRTDADGRFELILPAGTTEVGLTVGAPGHALRLVRLPSSDEQTLALGTSGGRLVLDLQRPGREGTPYLVHDGAIEAAAALAGWGTGDVGGDGPAVVEAIEPGVYALCLAGVDDPRPLWQGALPAGHCRTGIVEAGRTLTLSLP